MKKTIAILLVAILAVSSVFAAFSGKASVGFGGNLDNGNFGFIDQSTNAKIDLELATANAENVGEGDIYASIKASLVVRLYNGEKGATPDKPNNNTGLWLPVDVAIDEAKVGGENWYVSILGMPDGPDYAKSAIDTYDVKEKKDDYSFTKADYTGNYSFSVPYADTNGIEVGLFGYKFGFGLLGDYNEDNSWKLEDNLKFSVFAETPEYDFGGLTVQAAATYSYSGYDRLESGVALKSGAAASTTIDPDTGKPEWSYAGFSRTNAIGLAAKVGFANDTLSASIATDMGFNLEGDKFEDVFDMDLAANFGWSFLTLDAYYATIATTGETPDPCGMVSSTDGRPTTYDWDKTIKTTTEDVLSFQAKFDLNAFDVPVALTASVKDVLKTVELGVKAEVTAVENLKITANAGYVVNTIDAYDKDFNKANKDVFLGQWKFGADVEYDFGFAQVAAGISAKNVGASKYASDEGTTFDTHVYEDAAKKNFKTDADRANYFINQVILGASASITTSSIIPGAELKLAWENGDDLLKVYQYDGDDYYNFGKITASCKIAF